MVSSSINSPAATWSSNASESGSAYGGSLGEGSTTGYKSSPVKILDAVAEVALGNSFGCARKTDASLVCWGRNTFGSLGNGGTSTAYTPTAVTALGNDVAALFAFGSDGGCARRISNGHVECWGLVPPLSASTSPTEVAAFADATEIVIGQFHVCALHANGTVTCAASNPAYGQWGQAGNGTLLGTAQLAPVAGLPAASLATHLTAEPQSTCATLSTGAVYCWGFGFDGMFGNGVTFAHATPAPVAVPCP